MNESDCIDTVRCSNGRVRRTINNVETCEPDNSLNFERCDDDINCINNMKCRVGFIMDGDDCIVDRVNNFICTDNSLNSNTCTAIDTYVKVTKSTKASYISKLNDTWYENYSVNALSYFSEK